MKKLTILLAMIVCIATVEAKTMYDILAANLIDGYSVSTYFADANWAEETQSYATHSDNYVKVHIASDKDAQWTAQVKCYTGLTSLDSTKHYDFSVMLTSNKDCNNVTVKIFNAGADNDFGSGKMYEKQDVALTAFEPKLIHAESLPGKASDGIIVFDFGYASAGTEITIENIFVSPSESSGIYLRGGLNGWVTDPEYEFHTDGSSHYWLTDVTLYGEFKIADESWTTCNYGSNGNPVTVGKYYYLTSAGENISCGNETIRCERIYFSNSFECLYIQPYPEVSAPDSSGTCGDNLTWIYEDSILTISGTGSMWDYRSNGEDLAPWYNLAIKSVVIGEGVTSIGEYAFYNYQWLTTVELPSTLSYIDFYAFCNCNALTTIQAHGIEPPSLNSLSFDRVNTSSVSVYVPFGSGNAYRSASYWSGFNIIEPASGSGQCGENLTYTLVDGVLTITGTGEMYDYDYYSSRSRAPWSNATVTAVTVAEGATSIGNSAFSSLDSITEFTIPSTVTRIGDNAFSYCSRLTSIHIPNGVTSIGGEAFEQCSSLRSITIPNSVTSIGYEAFTYCVNLTHLYIPASVTETGTSNLVYDINLTNLTAPASIFSAPEHYFSSVEYYLSQYGPALPHNLDTLIINRGEMDAYALGTVVFSNKTMRYMNLGATTNTELPDEAFAHFYNLRSVVLPQGLQKLNYMALANCKSLESITIPASVQEIGMSAFENCYLLEEVIFDGNSSLTTIGNGAFYSCHELQRIAIPEGVTTIGKLAFYACTYLDEVELPASVRSLGDNAFAQCSRMKQMHVKAVVPPAIESKTFDRVSRLMPIYVPDASVAAYKADIYWGQMNIRSEDEPPTVSIFGQEVVIIDPEDSTIVAEVDVLGDSTLIYNTEENTLTFNGLTLEAGDSLSAAIRYVGSEPLTIVLVDSSAIIADTIISATANIIVRGDGYLAAEGVVPIIGVETATITFDSVNMYVHSLSSPAAVRRRIRGIKQLDETGGPALSGFASADFNKTAVTPPDAQYGEVEVEEAQGAPKKTINALYVRNSAGEKEVVTEFTLTALAEDDNAVENTIVTRIASKQIIHGQLYFTLPDGSIYTATGVKVK